MKLTAMNGRYLVCLAAALFPNDIHSHALGLHGLSTDADPTKKPNLPPITGAFEVEMNVRFNDFRTFFNPYATLFHFYNDDLSFSIWFGHRNERGGNLHRTFLEVKNNGVDHDCTNDDNIVALNQFYNYKFSVNGYGEAKILQDGVILAHCTGFTLPAASTTTIHYLGRSPVYDPNTSGEFTEPHLGVISGVRITNEATLPQHHPRELFKYMNFPGQVTKTGESGFVASFAARFDDLFRSGQTVFDFGNDGPDNNIFCGQKDTSNTLRCGIFQGGNEYSLSLSDALVSQEFAFYHFSVSATGEASLQKDDEEAVTASFGVSPTAVFRRNLTFGDSNWSAGQDLDGIVLGFRLDPTQIS